MTELRSFGRLEGVDVPEVVLRNGAGTEARIIAFGATLRDLLVPGPAGPQRVVVGLRTIEDYAPAGRYFGVVVGRYANRIGRARFTLDGREVRLVPNEAGNQLHGGPAGFGSRIWSLDGHDATSCRLSLVSEDGDMGYPGRLVARATYELVGEATLRITLEAEAEAPTPVNLTSHSYFNLDGTADIRDHRLRISAGFWLPVDEGRIPTGEVLSVEGTAFDFRAERPVRHPDPDVRYDHNFVLDSAPRPPGEPAPAATLSSERSGVEMELWTTEPGLQLYDGARTDLPILAQGELPLRPYCALALEPQRFPDGPNRAHFPAPVLRPGEVSRQVSEYRFRVRA